MANEKTYNLLLHYTSGGSDKFYQVSLTKDGEGWSVPFRYGRRGDFGQSGVKAHKLAYDKAYKAFVSVVREKMGKGYSTDGSGVPYSGLTVDEVLAGTVSSGGTVVIQLVDPDVVKKTSTWVPQLLNPISEAEVNGLLHDDAWGSQEKFDGKHMTLHWGGGVLAAFNKKNTECGYPPVFTEAFGKLGVATCRVDGEQVGDVFHAYDILELDGVDLRSRSYRDRHSVLLKLAVGSTIRVAGLAETTEEKQALLADLRVGKKEGIVFKRLAAGLTPGRPGTGGDMLKFKFVAEASVRVCDGREGKRSIGMEVLDGGGWVGVGNCTVPPNHEVPAVGSIVEVRYLYYLRGGALYQPVYKGLRDDVDAGECVIAQLKCKGEDMAATEVRRGAVSRRIRFE